MNGTFVAWHDGAFTFPGTAIPALFPLSSYILTAFRLRAQGAQVMVVTGEKPAQIDCMKRPCHARAM
jgi:hypothetical protein